MSETGAAAIPLVERADDAVLFQTRDEALSTRRLLRDVGRAAADLPEAAYICNLCQDRYRFVVTLLAGALRGQVNLLSSDRSPASLRSLADRFNRVIAVADSPLADTPLRHHVLSLPAGPCPDPVATPSIRADQLIAMVFTSGSTGTPVGHPKVWGSLTSRSRAAGRRFDMLGVAPVSVVGTVPAQHMYGFETTILLPLHTTSTSWCGAAFFPRDVVDALSAMPPPRALITTPLQMRSLLDADMDLPPLHCVISATAALAPELAARAERAWRTRVLEIYGATEVGSIASRRTLDGPMWTAYQDLRLAHEGDTDRVVVTSPHARPHALSDRIELQSPTEFHLLGRDADMVKLGGRRASLAGLNAILTSLSGVQDGVFVVPDDLGRHTHARLLAFVVAPERSADDLLHELRTRIEPVFLPRKIVLVASLPRNETGKLPRSALLRLMDGPNERTDPRR